MTREMRRTVLFWLIVATTIIALAQWAACHGAMPGYAQQCGPIGCRQGPHPATCRIRNQLGREAYLGSGTLIDKDRRCGLVVTCQHIFRQGKGTITCSFPDGTRYKAILVNTDGPWDLAALLILAPKSDPVTVAQQAARPGETVWSCGYGPDGQYWCNRGQVVGYVRTETTRTSETLELTGRARDGDSGGPVFNTEGELAAVLWGTDGRTVGGTYCGRVDKFLLTAGRYLLPWNAKINDPARDPRLQPPPPQQPPQVIVQPSAQGPSPPVDLAPIQARIDDLAKRQDALEARQDKVRDTAEALAKKYEDKLPGIAKDVQQAVSDSRDAKQGMASALDESNPNGIVGRIKARLDERLGGILETLPWLKYGLVGLAIGLGYLFLRKEGAKAAAGEPTLWQRAAALTPTEIDDRVAAKVATGQAALHERLASLHGTVANLAGSVSALAQNQKQNPPTPPTTGA